MWRRGRVHHPKQATSFVKHGEGGVVSWSCLLMNIEPLVCTEDVADEDVADGSRMDSELHRAALHFGLNR